MNREVICFDAVAPARERGLKSASNMNGFNLYNQAKKNNPFMDNTGFTKWDW